MVVGGQADRRATGEDLRQRGLQPGVDRPAQRHQVAGRLVDCRQDASRAAIVGCAITDLLDADRRHLLIYL
jgi:hypothetical protein